ncbi:MAG: HAD hydrolase-like protein [Candidatus Deferrimicrobiaceae bacterium]
MNGVTIGFDLDMTLLDTTAGITDTLRVLGAEEGVLIDTDDAVRSIGTPWHELIRRWFPGGRAEHATHRFRELYMEHGLENQMPLPGAADALDLVRRDGARPIVVTARYELTARACLERAGFDFGDDVTGSVFGPEKGAVLRAEGAVIYVGDTTSDVDGAHAAGARAVGVATGPVTEAELAAAGADVVLSDLREFEPWWEVWRESGAG